MSSSSTACPYCLEEIARQAHVCRHCHREVRLLLDTLAEVEELKARLAAASRAAIPTTTDVPAARGIPALGLAGGGTLTAAAAAVGRDRWIACGALLLFYLLPAPLMVRFADTAASAYLPVALAVLTGGVLACYGRSSVWMLAVYGFAQPLMSLVALVAFRVLEPGNVLPPIQDSLAVAAATALAGAAALLLFARDRLLDALTIEVPSQWLKQGEAGLGTVTNLVAAVAGLATVLVNLAH